MTEQYGFKFVVDANDAARGWKQFESAVEGVFGALDKMESHVDKTMTAVNKATKSGKGNISAFAKAASELGRIKVNASAAKNITTLSAAMRSFKAPSSAQVKNTQAFFRALEKAGTGGGATAGKNIGAIKSVMAGFKAPSATNVRNLKDFFAALSSYRSPSGLTNAAGFISTLRQLAGFKAPGAAQVRNLQAFLNTVANLKIPTNGAQVARVLEQIARAASTSSVHLRGLRGSLGGMPWRTFNAGAQSARVNMMGLQNAFSSTFQIGSVLRVLLGSLTLGELGTNFFEATNAALQFKAQMSVVSKELGFADAQLKYVNETANKFGVDMLAAERGFGKISIAAHKSGVGVEQTRHIFEGLNTAMSVLGVSTAGQGDVWLALQQVMNKGYLSAEELNQQLNEKLPGAMAYAGEYAASLGMTLEKGLKTKALDAAGVLEYMATRMKEDFGPAMAAALDRPSAQMTILKNKFNQLFQAIGENGGNEAFVDLLKTINEQLTPEKIEAYSVVIGEHLKSAVDKVTAAFRYLRDNWDSIKGPLSTTLDLLGKWIIVTSVMNIGGMIVSPIISAVGAFRNFIPVAGQALLLMRAMAATNMASFATSVRGMNPATIGVLTNIRSITGALGKIPTNPFKAIQAGVGQLGKATSGVGGMFLRLGGVIAVGLSAAMSAARDANKTYAADSYSTAQIVQGFFLTLGDNIASMWTGVTEFMADKFGWVGDAISGTIDWLQNFFKAFLINISFGFSKVGEGIFLSFKTAFQGVIGMIKDVGQALYALFTGDFAGAGQKAMDAFSLKSFRSAGAANFTGFASDMPGQKDRFASNVERGYEGVQNVMAGYGKRATRDDVTKTPPRRTYNPGLVAGETQTDVPEEEDKKKGKGRKPPKEKVVDAYKELDKLQQKADSIIRRLGEDNPVLKLQAEYVNDLTEQAQGLLTDKAYTDFNKLVADSQGDVTKIMEGLSDAITGTGADVAVLKDLEARYGITVDQITDSLNDQVRAYAAKTKAAKESMIPGFELLKQKSEEIRYARMSADQSEILKTVQEEVNKFKDKSNAFDQTQIDLMTQKLTLQQQHVKLLQAEQEFYQNNGIKKYTSEVQTAGEAVQEMDYNVMRSLEDTIFRIGKEGKISFKGLFDTIQDGLLKFASQGITEKLGGLLSGIGGKDEQNPTMMGKLFGAMGFDTGFDSKKAMDRINAQTVNLYAGRINTNGELETGIGAFASGSTAPANGDIVVNAAIKDPLTIAEESAKKLASGVDSATEAMKTDWSGAIKGMGPLFGMALGGALGGLIGGKTGSAIGSIASMLLPALIPGLPKGIFKEGGYSDKPVAWSSAPHYSEGTANTSGGMPAILHDNEAVIPLSRGRKVPVSLTGSSGGGSGTTINNVWNVQSPDADSFKRSQQQITGQMHRAANRAAQRNN